VHDIKHRIWQTFVDKSVNAGHFSLVFLIYFVVNNLLTNRQFGFLKGRSVVTQLWDKWTELLESGGRVDVIYTDFEKALDKVPHK